MKRPIDIEQLLTWAYCDELWKRDVSSAEANWENISGYGGLGGVAIGDSSAPQRYASIGAPHPDAMIIEHKVNGLAELLGGKRGVVTVDYHHSRAMLFGDSLLAPPTMTLRAYNIVNVVKSAASLKRRPTWNVGRIRPNRTLGANGKPMVEGVRPNGRYRDGAHCPLTWSPSLREIAETRAEYLLWHRALVELRSALADSLVAHTPTFPQAPQTPWNDPPGSDAIHKPKVLVTPQVIAAIHEGRKRRRIAAR